MPECAPPSPTIAALIWRGIGSPSVSEYVVTNNDPIAIATSEIKIARSAGVHRCPRSSSNLFRRGAGRSVPELSMSCVSPTPSETDASRV